MKRSVVWLLALLGSAAATSASSSDPRPPVASLRVYRAINSELLGGSLGDAGTHLGNTNAASAGGVLGYIHSEVVPSFAAVNNQRRNDIDAIEVFDVRVADVTAARVA